MFEYFYRRDDQEIFSGRKNELSLMEGYLLSKIPADIHPTFRSLATVNSELIFIIDQ